MSRKQRRNSQEGYALLTAMAVGVIVLSMTAALMLRLSSSTSQVVKRESQDEAQSISESVLNHVLDSFAEKTASGTGSAAGIYTSATALAQSMQGSDFLDTTANASSYNNLSTNPLILTQVSGAGNLPSGTNPITQHTYSSTGKAFVRSGDPNTFWNSLETNTSHSTTFWNAFNNDSTTNSLTTPGNINGVTLNDAFLESLHKQAYTVYHVKKGRMEADVEISVVPLATNIDGTADTTLHTEATFKSHLDVFKVRVVTFMPTILNPTRVHRVEVTINRPVKRNDARDYAFKQAVLAGGAVNLQNFNTSSGPCAAGSGGGTCIDTTTAGDVHSNTSIGIGPNGYVQGKVTSTGNVNVNGDVLPGTTYQNGSGAADPRNGTNVTNRVLDARNSQSQVDAIPIPQMDTSTASVDSTPCVNLGTANNRIYENCILTGDYSNTNGKSIEYRGTVHITGNIDIKGSQRCGSTSPCKVVIDGTADIGGNGSSNFNSTAETLYVVNGTGVSAGTKCLDVGGTPDASGQYGSLFYVNNPNCDTTVRGNSQFFGGIITKGTVGTMGNASQYGIQRDSDMTALTQFVIPAPVPKTALFPAVIAWKNLR